MTQSFRVRFLPEDKTVQVLEETSLLRAAQEADVYVGAICGGEGVCGKCRIIIREGEVFGESTEYLTRDEIRRGYVLACQVVPRTDLVVEVPPESRLVGYEGIGRDSERFRDFVFRPEELVPRDLCPLVQKYYLRLPEPTIDDPTPDLERLLAAVARQCPGPLQMGLKVIRDLPRQLRHCQKRRRGSKWFWHGAVTATVALRGAVHEVLAVEAEDNSRRSFGLALDIGTTTVVAHLVDLNTGKTVEAAAKYNSQLEYGADVISRINFARQPQGAERLHEAIIHDVEVLIDDLVARTHVGRGDIECVVAAGNTTMLHLLLGLETDLIRMAPFVPVAGSPPPIRAAEVGIRIHPRGLLYVLPMVGSFVGGDITAGILVAGIHKREELSLLLDIGTNGEVVLGSQEFLMACSASAGPAFEGGSVTCGMRATAGAIDSVRIGSPRFMIRVTTIEDAAPVGICGTGLIDLLAELFLAGLIDRNGHFQVHLAPERFRKNPLDGRPEFCLISGREVGSPRDVILRQCDIENLIRTKASIYAAIDSLVTGVGVSYADIHHVFIAGAFGNRLDVENCITIGLLPDMPPEKIHFIGNSSVSGAKKVMLSQAQYQEAQQIRERITYRELMVDPNYMEKFTSACFLPHTDVQRFPRVLARFKERSGREHPSFVR